jgi:putative ABC transport system permease protein
VTSAAIVSLALGIGANTTIFSLMDSLLLRTLPVHEPSRLMLLADAAGDRSTWSYPVWDGMRRNHPFEAAAAWSRSRFNLARGGETRFVDGLWASGSFFDTLGVRAIVGHRETLAPDKGRTLLFP